MVANELNPRSSVVTADAYVREAEPRWVTDGGTIERLRRLASATAEAAPATDSVTR